MDFDRITKYAESKGITIKDLALKIDVAYSGLYRSIKKKSITVDTLERIAEALEVPVTVFFGITQNVDNHEIDAVKKENEMLLLKNQLIITKLRSNQALIRLIRSRLKNSNDSYKTYCTNRSKIKLEKIEKDILSDIENIYRDTYNEILAAISFIERLTPGMFNIESLIEQ